MIPRIEQKLEFEKGQYIDFLKWLKFNNAKVLYPERRICSRYLDNKNMQMYYDTVEGLVPRKKIRIRTYETDDFLHSDSSYALEIKLTTEISRMKTIKKNINARNLLNNGYHDSIYGNCLEKIDISYIREYFVIQGIRVTIDKDIKYKQIKNNESIFPFIIQDKSYVLEIKTDINKDLTDLSNLFDFPRTKFSKYERAIESVYGI